MNTRLVGILIDSFPNILINGLTVTLPLTIISFALALVIALITALVQTAKIPVLRQLARFYVWVIRGTPLMLQIIVIYLGPGLLGMNNPWPSGSGGRMVAAVVAFAINYACYFSEIYRGGIESISKGQYEAGQVLGMTKPQIFFKVILLQVVKRIVPPMSNEVITLVKDTSLSFSLAYAEMFTIAKQIAAAQTTFIPFVVAAIFYYIFNLVVAVAMEKLEKKMNYYN